MYRVFIQLLKGRLLSVLRTQLRGRLSGVHCRETPIFAFSHVTSNKKVIRDILLLAGSPA